MSLTSKYSSTLCLVVLTTDSPDEDALFSPIKDYLYLKGFAPIEVRSPGEALIQTRHAKFFLVIVPDDDHDLIKKIKSDDGLNTDTIVIAISSEEKIKDTTQRLVDQNTIQHVIQKTADKEAFQKSLIDTINTYLETNSTANLEAANVPRVEEANNELTDISQPDNSYSRPFLSPLPMPQSHFSSMASQSGPIFFSANQAPPTTSQSQLSLSNQSYPLQPFALIPPMVVPFHALMQANSPNLNPNDENYMMPRIVDFGALQNRLASQMQQGFLPGFYKDCTTIDATELGKEGENNQSSLDKDPIKLDENSNNILVQESKEKSETTGNVPVGEEVSITSEPQGNNEPPKNIKLPGFAKFLECLQPQPAKDSLQDMDNSQDDQLPPTKRLRIEPQGFDRRTSSTEPPTVDADDEAKNPFSILQERPYFVHLDKQMEDIAFDPKVKSSDRHNAKERHRRIRITKASEFFKENIPCMNPTMDKATALHITVYYMLFLRNALRQMDPKIIGQLHQAYQDEWKPYFEKVSVPAE